MLPLLVDLMVFLLMAYCLSSSEHEVGSHIWLYAEVRQGEVAAQAQ